MFSQLGMLLGNQARYLQMVPASQAGEDVLVGHDLILIGEPANNPLVAEALKSAPVKIDGNTRAIQSTLLHLTVEDGQPVGLVQEFTSPWDKTRNVLVITGTSDAGVGWAAGILGNPTTRSSLKGDIAIVDRSGALTMLNSKAPETSRSLVATSLKNDQGPSEAVLWISAAAVLLVLVIGLVILLARRRTRAH